MQSGNPNGKIWICNYNNDAWQAQITSSNDEGLEIDFDIPSGIYTPECDKPLLSIGALIESGHHVPFTASFSGMKISTSSIPFVWLRGLW
jgi:hypothetical protein